MSRTELIAKGHTRRGKGGVMIVSLRFPGNSPVDETQAPEACVPNPQKKVSILEVMEALRPKPSGLHSSTNCR